MNSYVNWGKLEECDDNLFEFLSDNVVCYGDRFKNLNDRKCFNFFVSKNEGNPKLQLDREIRIGKGSITTTTNATPDWKE